MTTEYEEEIALLKDLPLYLFLGLMFVSYLFLVGPLSPIERHRKVMEAHDRATREKCQKNFRTFLDIGQAYDVQTIKERVAQFIDVELGGFHSDAYELKKVTLVKGVLDTAPRYILDYVLSSENRPEVNVRVGVDFTDGTLFIEP